MGKVKDAAIKAEEEEWEWKPRDDEEEVGGDLNIWNPAVDGKEGDELIGEVVELGEGVFGIEAKIKTPKSGYAWTTPAHKVLQTILARLSVGDIVRITYTGVYQAKNGLWTKTYKVARKR